MVLLSDYVYDSGITTIEDLQGNAIKFDGIINGTNPDAGKLCTIRKTALKELQPECNTVKTKILTPFPATFNN